MLLFVRMDSYCRSIALHILPPITLTNLHGLTQRRHAILIKALDRHPVRLPHAQRSQLEARSLIAKTLIGLVHLGRRDPPAHVVPDGPRHRLPRDRRIALVAVALRCEPRRRRGSRARPVAEHADV